MKRERFETGDGSENEETFEVVSIGGLNVSGRLLLTDPCYVKKGPPFRHGVQHDLRAVSGYWSAVVHKNEAGVPVALAVSHQDADPRDITARTRTYEVGVDSGQFGFFAAEEYSGGNESEDWYLGVTEITCKAPYAGEVPGGVVSGTTHGDGIYPASVIVDENGEATHAIVWFD